MVDQAADHTVLTPKNTRKYHDFMVNQTKYLIVTAQLYNNKLPWSFVVASKRDISYTHLCLQTPESKRII